VAKKFRAPQERPYQFQECSLIPEGTRYRKAVWVRGGLHFQSWDWELNQWGKPVADASSEAVVKPNKAASVAGFADVDE